jgi:hypothetical protein
MYRGTLSTNGVSTLSINFLSGIEYQCDYGVKIYRQTSTQLRNKCHAHSLLQSNFPPGNAAQHLDSGYFHGLATIAQQLFNL